MAAEKFVPEPAPAPRRAFLKQAVAAAGAAAAAAGIAAQTGQSAEGAAAPAR